MIMKNIKLGIQFKSASQGDKVLYEQNVDKSWTNSVFDLRPFLGYIENSDSSIMLMLTSIDSGHLLTLAQKIAGRGGDYSSAWIYIPESVKISGHEIEKIIDAIKDNKLLDDLTYTECLESLFSQEYESEPIKRKTIAGITALNKVAYRYYNGETKITLTELLDKRNQSYYRQYRTVFLLDCESNIECSDAKNLTDVPLENDILITAPDGVDGFVPYLEEKRFEGKIYVREGDEISLCWKREGYESITKRTIIQNDDYKWILPQREEYKQWVSYDNIRVVDEFRKNINEYQLKIGGQKVNPGGRISIKEELIENIEVEVEAEGYETFRNKRDMSKKNEIKLCKKTYEFYLPLKNGRTITLTGCKELDSPVEGYIIDKDNRYCNKYKHNLVYNHQNRTLRRRCLIGAIVIILVGFCGGYFSAHYIERPYRKEVNRLRNKVDTLEGKNEKLSKQNKKLEKERDIAQDDLKESNIKSAIKYLDEHSKWNCEEMGKYQELTGLWEAMNQYDFEKIRKFKSKLEGSKNFKDILKAIDDNKDKKFTGTYTSGKDFDISISRYIDELFKKK